MRRHRQRPVAEQRGDRPRVGTAIGEQPAGGVAEEHSLKAVAGVWASFDPRDQAQRFDGIIGLGGRRLIEDRAQARMHRQFDQGSGLALRPAQPLPIVDCRWRSKIAIPGADRGEFWFAFLGRASPACGLKLLKRLPFIVKVSLGPRPRDALV